MITDTQREYINDRLENSTRIIPVRSIKSNVGKNLELSEKSMLREIKRLCNDTINEIESGDDEHLIMCLTGALQFAVYLDIVKYNYDEFSKLGYIK